MILAETDLIEDEAEYPYQADADQQGGERPAERAGDDHSADGPDHRQSERRPVA
jgi:hypothetical protein